MKGSTEKGNILGVGKHSAAQTILLVNWQPATRLITKLLYGQEKNNLTAEQFVFLPKRTPCCTDLAREMAALLPLTCGASSAQSLGSHRKMQMQPRAAESPAWASPVPRPERPGREHVFCEQGVPRQPRVPCPRPAGL